VAAVADYRPAEQASEKIKKTADTMQLNLVKNPDILAILSLSENRPFCVGFAAETGNLEGYARKKLEAKKLDLIFANNAADTFNSESSLATAYWHDGEYAFPKSSKSSLAREMIGLIADRYRQSQKSD